MDTRFLKACIVMSLASLIVTVGTARADDTDVYMNPGAGLPPGSEPMVMFSLDYRPNLGSAACTTSGECDSIKAYLPANGPYTFFDVLRASLKKVFEPLEGVRVGLMLNHSHNQNCEGFGRTQCSNGGYIAMGFERFEKGASDEAKKKFHDILASIPTPLGNQSHPYQGKELFFEFFRYLTGQGVYNAHNGFTDYATDNKYNLDEVDPSLAWDQTAIAWDPTIETGAKVKREYISPIDPEGACSKIYTVNVMFQVSNLDDDSGAAIDDPISSGGFGSPQREFPDVIQYLNDADLANGNYGTVPDLDDKQNVISYFIVEKNMINTMTRGYARAGGTGVPLPLSENPDDLVAQLQEVFRQILSVSTTFVAASVPVNVFNRAEITDNVYIALFQVDEQARPYWVGNVKKLRLAGANDASTDGVLVDSTGNPAIAADGRIRFDALTDWTLPNALPPADTDAGEVDGRDGRVVARGGAGQRIPGLLTGSPREANGLGGRTIYYDRTSTSLAPLNVDLITAADLQADFDVSLASEAADLIAYARGLDIDDLDGDGEKGDAREWLFGDALHSRPLPLNYGAMGSYVNPANPAIYLAVATNDGLLRMIRNTRTNGAQSGEEVWAFMPRRAMESQKVLRANGTGMKHPYTIDGAPVAFMLDRNQDGSIVAGDGDKVYLYVGMRRGGKAYYAFDVTNPESPDLMWTLEKSGDFAELGYTFSNPRVGLVDSPNGPTPVLMFAGGYDMNKDTRGSVGTDDTEGNAIYVVNAETGQLIWKAVRGSGSGGARIFEHPRLTDSIPSTLAIGDTDGDGFTDRILVGDTGGNVWRADIHGPDTSNWKLSLLAALGRHGTGASGIASDRRFFHRPDLVPSKDGNGLFDAVVIGSGNRPNPLDTGGMTTDYAFMIKDRHTAPGSGLDDNIQLGQLGDVTSNCLQSQTPCTVDLSKGWRLMLTEPGEKVLATPLTITGKVFFTTYLPQAVTGATACSPSEGAGRLYAVALQDAKAVINYDTSDDDPDNPDQPHSVSDRSVELQSLGIPAEVVSVPPNKILRPDLQIDNLDATTRWRTFWYLAEDEDL
jgi:type IV pilus assembly protein PilY1